MKILGIFLMTLLILPIFAEEIGSKARLEKKGDIWILDKGATHGVKVGLEGYFFHKKTDPQTTKSNTVKIAHFKINRVFKVISYAIVDKWTEGFTAKDAQWAQFIDKLTPPPGTKTTDAKKYPQKETAIAPGKDRRWYLDEGEKEMEKGNYETALRYYQKVLEKDSEDPGALQREKQAKGKLYSHQGDLEFQNGELSAAFEYFLMAFQNLEKSEPAISEKILEMWDQNESFYSKIKDLKVDETAILETVINSCDNALKENDLEKTSKLLDMLKRRVRNEQLKLKLDDLDISREIYEYMTSQNYAGILDIIDQSLDRNNLYKANFIANKLEGQQMAETETQRFATIKEKLVEKQEQIELQKESLLKEEKIKSLMKKADAHVKLKEFDKAIDIYIQVIQLEPTKSDKCHKKIKDIQLQKFEYEQAQKDIKAKLDRDSMLLRAESNGKKELIQDALDAYIKAYIAFPEDGKAIAGIVKTLETCGKEDAGYITSDLLERKFGKFKKDFIGHLNKNYPGKRDETAYNILVKVTFLKDYQPALDLMDTLKKNLYKQYMDLGDKTFDAVDFSKALPIYQKAASFQKSEIVEKWIQTCTTLAKIEEFLKSGKKKSAGNTIKSLPHANRFRILTGLTKLAAKYYEQSDSKTGDFIKNKIGAFDYDPKVKELIKSLKDKKK